jgi:hypothetical protein
MPSQVPILPHHPERYPSTAGAGPGETVMVLKLAAIGSRDTSGQGQALVGQGSSQSRRGVTGPTMHAGTLSRMGVMPGGPLAGMVDPRERATIPEAQC